MFQFNIFTRWNKAAIMINWTEGNDCSWVIMGGNVTGKGAVIPSKSFSE